MTYVFGDLHFSCLNPWNLDIGSHIIEWFKTRFSSESKTNNAVFLGDITERDVNAGNVIDQVDDLFNFMSSHFYKVYVLIGNHDLKLYKKQLQHSLKFLKRKYNVEIIEKPQDIIIDGLVFRCLPFIRQDSTPIESYYSNYDCTDKPVADVIVGHWNIMDKEVGLPIGVNPSKLNGKNFILGHIHNRLADYYTGSVAPNNKAEYTPDVKRVFKIVNDDGTISNEEIPHFVRYETIFYPEKIKKSDENIVTIYTVEGIKSIQEANAYYKDAYIKSVSNVKKEELKNIQEAKSDFVVFKDLKESMNSFIKETKYPMSRYVYNVLLNLSK